ncbi:MAG: hypothetical protein WCP39_01070 [Chlamydiota bacterium]
MSVQAFYQRSQDLIKKIESLPERPSKTQVNEVGEIHEQFLGDFVVQVPPQNRVEALKNKCFAESLEMLSQKLDVLNQKKKQGLVQASEVDPSKKC